MNLENVSRQKEDKKLLMVLKAKVFPIEKQTKEKEINILSSKEMLKRLTIMLAQIKAGNLSEVSQYFLYRAKEINEEGHHNIIN